MTKLQPRPIPAAATFFRHFPAHYATFCRQNLRLRRRQFLRTLVLGRGSAPLEDQRKPNSRSRQITIGSNGCD